MRLHVLVTHKITNNKSSYRLYLAKGLTCHEIINAIHQCSSILGKFCLCTSVDSGTYGFPEIGPRYGRYTGFNIREKHLKDWPTYSGSYDEWYIFNEELSSEIEVNALCNWGCNYSAYEKLENCHPDNCKMNEYIDKYSPLFIVGCNDEDGYIFSSIKLEVEKSINEI